MAYNSRGSGVRGVIRAFQNLSILTASALSLFVFTSLVMLGIAGDIISWMESYRLMPATIAFASLAMVFASSQTRDARHYHAVEWGIVLASIALMVAYSFLDGIQTTVTGSTPLQIGAFLLFMAASAVLSR